MPSLICSSRYTIDSQILRKVAQQLGWETLRLDGNRIPDWFDPPDRDIAFFYTAPHVFDIGKQLHRTMLGCNPDWCVNLPSELLRRELHQTTLANAQNSIEHHFVKHAVSKAFPAAVYNQRSLAEATASIHPDSLVHVGEPVRWTHEYRCFVANRKVLAVSPYVYDGITVKDYDSFPTVPVSELAAACAFAESVLSHPDVNCPEGFVLDVGKIADRGWAVVECNECWASGIYACDPVAVLDTLLCGNIEASTISTSWDFSQHYSLACPRVEG